VDLGTTVIVDVRRLPIIAVVAAGCLIVGFVLGLVAIVAGGLWLLFLALLFVVAAIVLDQVSSRSGSVAQALTEPLVAAVIVVAVLAFAGYAFVRPLHGSAPRSSPPASSHGNSVRTIQSAPATAPSGSSRAAAAGYVTAGTDVHLRAAASRSSAIVTTMTRFATPVSLSCYQEGDVVFSAPYWYRAAYDGFVGYVSELWLDTGSDPTRTGLPRC
jgi:hypothetical protein